MPTKKKAPAKKQTASADRCWTGYEPVPGKKANEKGSCRKKAASKSTPKEKEAQAKRKRQLDRWEKEHPGSPRSAAQHLKAPGAKKRAPAAKKRSAKGK